MAKIDFQKGVGGLEKFAKGNAVEILTAIAVIVAMVSVWKHLFIGTVGWSLFFLGLGAIVGIFFSEPMDRVLKHVTTFSFGESTVGVWIAEVIKIAIALFLPFIYFAFLGLLSGTSYQYYSSRTLKGKGA